MMNFKPLLKALGLLAAAWILFMIARFSFQDHSDEHLGLIPANSDVVIIINNSSVGKKIFDQRVHNEDSFKKNVSVDDELERWLVEDAVLSDVDLIGPVGVFSYSVDGEPLVGICVKAKTEGGLTDVIAKYWKKLEIPWNHVETVKGEQGLILVSQNWDEKQLKAEAKNIMESAYGKAMDQDWFAPISGSDHDMVAYFNPFRSSGSPINDLLQTFTPGIVEHSYTFVNVGEDKLDLIHRATTIEDPHLFFVPQTPVLTKEGEATFSLGFNMEEYRKHTMRPLRMPIEISTDDTTFVLEPWQFLKGGISGWFGGTEFTLANPPRIQAVSELLLEVHGNEMQAYLDTLHKYEVVGTHGEWYELDVVTHHVHVHVHMKLDGDNLILAFHEGDLQGEILNDQVGGLSIDFIKFAESLDLGPFDCVQLEPLKGVDLEILELTDKEIVFQGEVKFTGGEHGIIDVLDLITHYDQTFGSMFECFLALMKTG